MQIEPIDPAEARRRPLPLAAIAALQLLLGAWALLELVAPRWSSLGDLRPSESVFLDLLLTAVLLGNGVGLLAGREIARQGTLWLCLFVALVCAFALGPVVCEPGTPADIANALLAWALVSGALALASFCYLRTRRVVRHFEAATLRRRGSTVLLQRNDIEL